MKKYFKILLTVAFLFTSIYPSPLLKKEWDAENSKVQVFARNIAQGEVILLKVVPRKKGLWNQKLKVYANQKEVPVRLEKDAWISWIPIHPEEKLGPMPISLEFSSYLLSKEKKEFTLNIQPTRFPVTQSIRIDPKFTQKEYDPETLAFIEECKTAKEKAFQSDTPLQFTSGFVYPVAKVSLSSPFYARRIYNKEMGNPHKGLDFRGREGTPIYAINQGTVVLARDMFFEGKFTIIDHGNRIFSLYMHQSKILVKPGQVVRRGQKIGEIGSTGMSTGPHLHLGVLVNGTYIDPLSLLEFRTIP